jgi:hypothetical protein
MWKEIEGRKVADEIEVRIFSRAEAVASKHVEISQCH